MNEPAQIRKRQPARRAQQPPKFHHCNEHRTRNFIFSAEKSPPDRRKRNNEEQPHSSIVPVETLIWEREEKATCQSVIAQSNWSKLVKQPTLVKCSNMVKYWSNERGLTINIDIFEFPNKFGL